MVTVDDVAQVSSAGLTRTTTSKESRSSSMRASITCTCTRSGPIRTASSTSTSARCSRLRFQCGRARRSEPHGFRIRE